MKIHRLKKLLVTLIVTILFASCASTVFNISTAKEGDKVENWENRKRSYWSIGLNIKDKDVMKTTVKNLFYDTKGVYQNLNCIRSGSVQDNTYTEHDLYQLKEKNPQIFNALFKGNNLTDEQAYRNYLHVIWEIENFYLFNDEDSEADRQAKFDKYSDFIGASRSSLPYGINESTDVELIDDTWTGDFITITKNELLVKALQNEMLLDYVVQTYNRQADLSTIYDINFVKDKSINYTAAKKEVQDYAKKIVDKFTKLENSEEFYNSYKEDKNINYYFNSNPEIAKVQLRSNTENADTVNNISGSFYVKNKYKATVTGLNVYINEIKQNDFKVLDANGDEITDYLDAFTNSASDSEYEFKIFWNGLNEGNNKIRIELDVDYGDIITATLLEPENKDTSVDKYGNVKGCQYVVNINKDHKRETVKVEGDTTGKKLDLALTKQIVLVEAPEQDEINNNKTEYNRAHYVDTSRLDAGKSTNAEYIMDKDRVRVKPGSKVTYSIKVFNEGEIDGFAEEITDYLPEYLSMVPTSQSEINATYGWEDNGDGTITTSCLSSNRNANSSNILHAYSGSLNFNNAKEIKLECYVSENTPASTTLNNRAEISKYGYYADLNGDGVKEFVEATDNEKDRDSIQNSVLNDSNASGVNNPIKELINQIDNIISERKIYKITEIDKNRTSYEDDDDVERIYVTFDTRKMDLALRKWITKVDGKELENSREPYQLNNEWNYYFDSLMGQCSSFANPDPRLGNAALREGRLPYEHTKEAVEVEPGSIITYTIGIFNEGTADAYAEEITDYLPAGLEFVENDETNKKYGWKATKNDDGTTTVKTDILSYKNGKTIPKFTNEIKKETTNMIYTILKVYGTKVVTENDVDIDAYKTIQIVCKVSDDLKENKNLTNRAEISKYGYISTTGEFLEANQEDIDRDSIENTIKDDLNLDTWYETNYVAIRNFDTPIKFFPGVEDDDDFETVAVKYEPKSTDYSIQIKKVSSNDNNKTIEGAIFAINNVVTKKSSDSEPTDSKGITELLTGVVVNNEATDVYEITEKYVPDLYVQYADTIKVSIAKKLVNNKYVIDKDNIKVIGKNVTFEVKDSLIIITIPNPEKEFDLALRKFISAVNDTKLDEDISRVPQIDAKTLINGDETKNGEKTATYKHPKDPVTVNPKDVVEYTLRIYNEGELDGFASRIIDDVPEGVTMVAPEFDKDGKALNTNAKYGWVMYKEMDDEDKDGAANVSMLKYNDKYYIETKKAEEAVIISTDYLSRANGIRRMKAEDTVNPNLILAFTGSRLYFKDIKVDFQVKPTKNNNTIITNYAQISEHEYKDGTAITDRDSTPNVWKDDEDDQDIEKIKVNWFDLALYKWVSSTIVTEDGKTKEYESNHTQADKDAIVNVTIAKDKLNKTVVKFKWQIKVKNEGTLAGYATELKDHVPAGLKFVEEDNKDFGWKSQEDGTVTTDYLKNTLLQPSETAELPLVLTWVNGENNMGVKVNYAEISEDFNAYDTPDIDSTPNNFKDNPAEDDEDKDEVRLNVRTGSGETIKYILITVACIVVLAVGVVMVKKNVLEK